MRWELWPPPGFLSDHDIVVRNGRVRAGYEIGGLVGADVVLHLIGERPGTGLNTLSAYITYGRDEAGNREESAAGSLAHIRDLRHSSHGKAAAGGRRRNRAHGGAHYRAETFRRDLMA